MSKMSKAFCPEKNRDLNPVLDWAENIIFKNLQEMKIERPYKFGGDVVYVSYKDLEDDFISGKLHPMDLKKGVAQVLIKLLEPARKHFERPKIKKMKEELEEMKITR